VVGLTALGARLAQGFYFGRPMEPAAIDSLLRAGAQKAS
jgi:EAL domain-containing protein (putative c-di-GMP-specific phosphodiesterase class I)